MPIIVNGISGGSASTIETLTRWAVKTDNEFFDITLTSFDFKGTTYPVNFVLTHDDDYLFNLGLYKIIANPPNVTEFQKIITLPIYQWVENQDNQTLSIKYEIQDFSQYEIQSICYSYTQVMLNDFAREKGYESILSATSYVSSSNTNYQQEGKRCVEIRDNVWEDFFKLFEDILNKKTPQPKCWNDVKAQLPPLTWS